MIDFLTTNNILLLLFSYGYLIYFLLAVVEGPIVTIIAGLLISLKYFNFFLIYGLAILGDLFGDILYYQIGRFGRKRLTERGRLLSVKAEQVKKIEEHFKQHAGKTFLFAKWTHVVGAPILMAAGVTGVPLKKFIWFNFLGTVPKVLVFIAIGYYFGQAYQQIDKYFGYATLSFWIIVALIALIYFLRKKFAKDIKID